MEHIDFVQRVDTYEQERADKPEVFGRHVFWLTMLAVLWVWGGLLMGLALIAWAVLTLVNQGFRDELIFGFFGGLALVVSVMRLTRSDWIKPEGIAVPQGECPRLYEALGRIRQKTGGPRIHQLVITEAYGARIVQQVRAGGLLPARQYLLLGLPLAMAIDRPRLMAVLAQEYSHLRRSQGWFAALVYRARRRLQGLHDRLADSRQMTRLGWMSERFMRWYLPRWWAASFVVARQDELLADRLAARLVNKEMMGDALSEVAVRGRWFRERFWVMHWSRARQLEHPIGPFSLMAGVMNHTMDVNWVYQAWQQEYQAPAGYTDTHPGLRERLEALGVPRGLTPMSGSNCLAWLGKRSARWIEILDERWCARFADDWAVHRQVLQQTHARVEALMPKEPYLQADGLVELGWYMQAHEYRDDPLPFYTRALELQTNCKRAVAAVASLFVEMDPEAQLPYLAQAFDLIPAMRSQWCAMARGVLDVLDADEHYGTSHCRTRTEWAKREEIADRLRRDVADELQDLGMLYQAKSYAELVDPLWESELVVLKTHLARAKRLRRAWLLARPLQSARGSQALVLVLDRPGVGYQEAQQWEAQLYTYLERELLVCKLMPVWLVNVDELGDKADKVYRVLDEIPAALLCDRTVG
ncbi:MAG: M48 family metallopeptidase [Comamonas sp.]